MNVVHCCRVRSYCIDTSSLFGDGRGEGREGTGALGTYGGGGGCFGTGEEVRIGLMMCSFFVDAGGEDGFNCGRAGGTAVGWDGMGWDLWSIQSAGLVQLRIR